jgi:hypothetical protein
MKKTKQTLAEDMSNKFIHLIYDILKKNSRHHFTYYHDTYIKGKYEVHMHKFKTLGIMPDSELEWLCNQLVKEGITGFQPTSKKTESYSGIIHYHKVRI